MAGFLEQLGSMFSGLAGAQDGVHVRIWSELKPWVGNLLPSATRKWLPRIAGGVICEVPIIRGGHQVGHCDHFGVAACDVCHRPVCLEHSRIDQHGDAICYVCVADAIHAVPPVQRERERARKANGTGAPPPPPRNDAPPPKPKQGPSPEMVVAALNALGLRRGAKWESVRVAHRKLSAANHPDKHKTPRAKNAANARFVEIQQAFELLKLVYPDAA